MSGWAQYYAAVYERFVVETAELLLLLLSGERLDLATLRRRVRYGGRKGRRAARRLRAAGVRP